jgi:hypothetical protein
MSYLQEHPKVDIKHSVIDEKNSNPALGIYEFIEKKYVNYQDPEVRPPWYFAWCRWTDKNNYAEFNDWKTKYGYSLVTVEDGYWPEGLAPDADGKYVTGDSVLVKCPLRKYIQRRLHEIKISEQSTQSIIARFKQETKDAGVDLDDRFIRQSL